jgi:hypothetical protein
MEKHRIVTSSSKYASEIKKHFLNGFMGSPTIDLVDALNILNVFFHSLDEIKE